MSEQQFTNTSSESFDIAPTTEVISSGVRAARGFARMDPARQKEIAKKGGMAAHKNGHAHKFSSEEAREAGKKGGKIVSQNRQHMAEIGKKGGEARKKRKSLLS